MSDCIKRTETRIVTKALLTAEDAVKGFGKVAQIRASGEKELTMLNASELYGVSVIKNLKQLTDKTNVNFIPFEYFGNTKVVFVEDQARIFVWDEDQQDWVSAETEVYDTINSFDLLETIQGKEGGMILVSEPIRGGLFLYDKNRAGENDKGIVVNGWVRVFNGDANIKWFGAVADGATDNYEAFKNALEVSDQVSFFIPRGEYIIQKQINITKYKTLSGEKIKFRHNTFVSEDTKILFDTNTTTEYLFNVRTRGISLNSLFLQCRKRSHLVKIEAVNSGKECVFDSVILQCSDANDEAVNTSSETTIKNSVVQTGSFLAKNNSRITMHESSFIHLCDLRINEFSDISYSGFNNLRVEVTNIATGRTYPTIRNCTISILNTEPNTRLDIVRSTISNMQAINGDVRFINCVNNLSNLVAGANSKVIFSGGSVRITKDPTGNVNNIIVHTSDVVRIAPATQSPWSLDPIFGRQDGIMAKAQLTQQETGTGVVVLNFSYQGRDDMNPTYGDLGIGGWKSKVEPDFLTNRIIQPNGLIQIPTREETGSNNEYVWCSFSVGVEDITPAGAMNRSVMMVPSGINTATLDDRTPLIYRAVAVSDYRIIQYENNPPKSLTVYSFTGLIPRDSYYIVLSTNEGILTSNVIRNGRLFIKGM